MKISTALFGLFVGASMTAGAMAADSEITTAIAPVRNLEA